MPRTKPRVNIGISAYNEEANIRVLLQSLLAQKQDKFSFGKIIVISDGSTDRTVIEAREVHAPAIKIIDSRMRRGLAARQNEIIRHTDSDILVFLDADITIKDRHFVNKLILPIINNRADLSSCGYNAIKPGSFMERTLAAGLMIRNYAFNNYQQGNNIYNCRGSARAFSKDLYTAIRFPKKTGEDMFSYLFTIENGYKFQFVHDTEIFLKLPESIEDHWKQSIRFIKSGSQLADDFTREVIDTELKLPTGLLVKGMLRALYKKPLATPIYAGLYVWTKLEAKKRGEPGVVWNMAESSKDTLSQGDKKADKIFVLRGMIYRLLRLAKYLGIKNYPRVFILCYHSVARDNWRFSIDPKEFRKQIEYLLARFEPIKLSTALDFIEGKAEISKNSFVLTFDDGYRDNLEIAEYLREKGIYPAIFLLSDSRQADKKELGGDHRLLKRFEIGRLHRMGWEIGCHSRTHTDFGCLEGERIEEEVGLAKSELEKKLNMKVKYFSYPKGRYDKVILNEVKKAKYKAAVTMDDSIINKKTDLLAIPRVGVDGSHSFKEFKALFTIPAIYMRKTIKKSLKINNHTRKCGQVLEESILQKILMFFINRLANKPQAGRPPIPEKIGNYKLVEKIYRPPGDDQYQFGIYQNKQGKKGIVKQWDGKRKDGDYFWLINEIKIYQGLDQMRKQYGCSIKSKFPKLRVPGLLKVIKEKDRVVLFMEMLEGKTLDSISSMPKRMEAFQDVIKYFQYIGELLKREKMDKFFLKRNNGHTILIFGYMFLRACAMYPGKIPQYLRGLLAFITCLPAIFRKNEFTFVHRDLTYMNVLVMPDGSYGTIDFELAVYTHPFYEITQIVTGSWHQKNFCREFYKLEIMKEILSDNLSCRVYKGLTVFTAIHRLATSPKKDFKTHYSYLLHSFKLKATNNFNNVLNFPGTSLGSTKSD